MRRWLGDMFWLNLEEIFHRSAIRHERCKHSMSAERKFQKQKLHFSSAKHFKISKISFALINFQFCNEENETTVYEAYIFTRSLSGFLDHFAALFARKLRQSLGFFDIFVFIAKWNLNFLCSRKNFQIWNGKSSSSYKNFWQIFALKFMESK